TMYNMTYIGQQSSANPSTTLYADGHWASSDFTYQHSKYAILDNKTLILSSGNWAKTSCPTPQDDGDVDGNRDWWIVVYGDNPGDLQTTTTNSNNSQNDFFRDHLFYISAGGAGILIIAIVGVCLYNKAH
ncbi:MAG: hypothetical protein ACTSWL_02705, partial [Promethearchaeota archaeon]